MTESFEIEPVREFPLVDGYGSWGFPVPESATLRIREEGTARDLIVEAAILPDTSVKIVELTLNGTRAAPITADTLRALKLGSVVTAIRRYVSGLHREVDAGRWLKATISVHDTADVLMGLPDVLPSVPGFESTDSHIAEIRAQGPRSQLAITTVTDLYAYAESKGYPPNRFVATMLRTTEATASRWIDAARDSGAPIPENPRARRRKAK